MLPLVWDAPASADLPTTAARSSHRPVSVRLPIFSAACTLPSPVNRSELQTHRNLYLFDFHAENPRIECGKFHF